MENNYLKIRKIEKLEGEFVIKSYQRGYRWTKKEVNRLLNDIYDLKDDESVEYCLQPIVVKKIEDDKYELIDGQQRLTTLFLIFKSIEKALTYSINYDIKGETKNFLENIDETKKYKTIDNFYISEAREEIEKWFKEYEKKTGDFLKCLERTNIIWYEVDKEEDSTKIFERLNIGKIELTNSELVKALFLSEISKKENDLEEKENKQKEIALEWDNIEKELHNEKFWYFLTNEKKAEDLPRIDLILDLYTKEKNNNTEKYFSYFKINDEIKEDKAEEIWYDIKKIFYTLKDWFQDHNLYHKIGYLIQIDSKNEKLKEIYELSKGKKKSEFLEEIDKKIANSLGNVEEYNDYEYNNSNDNEKLKKLLILYNIETVRKMDDESQWFPFDKFNKGLWSLEHIHPQNPEDEVDQKDYKEWLKENIKIIKEIKKYDKEHKEEDYDELINKVNNAIDSSNDSSKIEPDTFRMLSEQIIKWMENEYSNDSLENLALLDCSSNASLSNSIFGVKRDKIIQLDKDGKFIPFCTKKVFFKYYTPTQDSQLYFWSKNDMMAYIDDINTTLEKYFKDKKIVFKGDRN